ncbi:MAG TPA: RDD family protein [Chitinophagaceae bacterium]|nr:RDD family protein [Chitinophagaceae bacterium]
MSVIKVPTSFNIDVEFEIPEFYRRLISLLIDMLIEFFYWKIAYEIIKEIARNSNVMGEDFWFNIQTIWMLLFMPIIFYHLVLEITMNGQSIGKKIMGIKVVHENGARASISQFIIRWLLRISDVWIVFLIFFLASNNEGFGRDIEGTFIIIGALAFLTTDIVLVVSSKKGQRIGDMLAHTILIRTNTRTSIEETVFQEVADTYVPSFPQIMQLGDKDINAIKSILETAKKKGDFNMAATASEKIKAHLKIDTTMSPFDFLEVLLKDYNYLSVK